MSNAKTFGQRFSEFRTSAPGRFLGFAVIIIIAIVTVLQTSPELGKPVAIMLGILVAAALLWATETIPLFATSLLIIGAQILFLGNPGNWSFLRFAKAPAYAFQDFLSPISDPIIVLFLGGFILAKVGVKVNVDSYVSSVVLRIFGFSASRVLLGVMVSTLVFGMWISNTATTAMMITLTGTFLASVPPGHPFRKALTLAIPFSAGIGGLMTPISSPPNAIAIGLLAQEGVRVDFLTWMVIMAPVVLVLFLILYLLIWYRYLPSENLRLPPVAVKPFPKSGYFVMLIFTITVLLWLTDSTHGMPAAVVALFPVIMFTATGFLNAKEFNSLEWNILFVIAGGLALGQGMSITGLDKVIAGMLPLESNWIVLITFALTMFLGTFMSNTTTAILFIPMGISMAQVLPDVNMKFMAIGLAVMAGSSMALPISTPPNAIAYSTGEVSTSDFATNGIFLGLCTLFLTYGYFWLLRYFGLL